MASFEVESGARGGRGGHQQDGSRTSSEWARSCSALRCPGRAREGAVFMLHDLCFLTVRGSSESVAASVLPLTPSAPCRFLCAVLRVRSLITALIAQAHAHYTAGRYKEAQAACEQVYLASAQRTDNLLLLGAIHFQVRASSSRSGSPAATRNHPVAPTHARMPPA